MEPIVKICELEKKSNIKKCCDYSLFNKLYILLINKTAMGS